ncbi:MAG: (deoxy)nucleoside triphosphate pyrophosphohydrolase [Myxococcota bacterium]
MSKPAEIAVVGAAILRPGACLVCRRGPGMRLAGKWEFPGGKVEPGETPADALRREILEELGLRIEVKAWLGRGFAPLLDGRVVRLEVFEGRWTAGSLKLAEHDAARWVGPARLSSLDWAEADIPIVPAVRTRLGAKADQFGE